MFAPVMFYLWWSVLLFDPRAPEDRAPRNARGREVYAMGKV
ncbi:hypothetical protein [Paraburkholderia phenoliruptrix]